MTATATTNVRPKPWRRYPQCVNCRARWGGPGTHCPACAALAPVLAALHAGMLGRRCAADRAEIPRRVELYRAMKECGLPLFPEGA